LKRAVRWSPVLLCAGVIALQFWDPEAPSKSDPPSSFDSPGAVIDSPAPGRRNASIPRTTEASASARQPDLHATPGPDLPAIAESRDEDSSPEEVSATEGRPAPDRAEPAQQADSRQAESGSGDTRTLALRTGRQTGTERKRSDGGRDAASGRTDPQGSTRRRSERSEQALLDAYLAANGQGRPDPFSPTYTPPAPSDPEPAPQRVAVVPTGIQVMGIKKTAEGDALAVLSVPGVNRPVFIREGESFQIRNSGEEGGPRMVSVNVRRIGKTKVHVSPASDPSRVYILQ
jgi:hypothetical protein